MTLERGDPGSPLGVCRAQLRKFRLQRGARVRWGSHGRCHAAGDAAGHEGSRQSPALPVGDDVRLPAEPVNRVPATKVCDWPLPVAPLNDRPIRMVFVPAALPKTLAQ